MANMLDNVAVRSIAKHRNKLMSLVESTKKRKKKKQKTWAVPPSNIEHLVFKKIPTSPIDPGPNFIGNRLNFGEESEADDPEEDSYDELDTVSHANRPYEGIACAGACKVSELDSSLVRNGWLWFAREAFGCVHFETALRSVL
ncbi:uncharacterized protein CEXT_354581 [Caerostris extrusa]|uniref:Uncharacterized protein n=1 Tax=Caerostris extrusa TaxID=172846 RepID=A0AAV4R9I0_CAEEX|nr:uncharacterized protein CEXT_354581 [Caerostris extrusa]